MKKLIVVVVTFFGGCSFHSSQLDFIRELFSSEEGPKPNWEVHWSEGVTEASYAINVGAEVWFANSDVFR